MNNLKEQKRRLLAQLKEALANHASDEDVTAIQTKLQALDTLQQHERQVLYPALAICALVLASALWLLPYQHNQFSLIVQANQVSFTLEQDADIAQQLPLQDARIIGAQSLSAEGLGVVAQSLPDNAQVLLSARSTQPVTLHQISIDSQATVALRQLERRLVLEARSDKGVLSSTMDLPGGASLSYVNQQLVLPPQEDRVPESIGLTRTFGENKGWFRLSALPVHTATLVEPVRVSQVRFLTLNREQQVAQSAIQSGTLVLPQQDRNLSLLAGSTLRITGQGSIQIRSTENHLLEIHYQGVAKEVSMEFLGQSQPLGMNQLQALAKNQSLLTFWSALAFIWVLLKGVRQFV